MSKESNEQLKDRAKKRVGFKLHLAIAVAGNGLMWFIYFVTWTGYPWPVWFLAASILSLFIHWLAIFSNIFSSETEYKRLQRK